MSPQPDVDVGDLHGGVVSDGELVVAGGEAAVLFVPVDAALDSVPLAVLGGVECRRATARRAPLSPVGLPVGLDRDRSEEHTSELRHANISYVVFCFKKK